MTLAAAKKLMNERRIRRLPMLETGDSKLIGILSMTDVTRALALTESSKTPLVRDALRPDPITITADAPIEAAASLMRDRKIGALPVVRGDTVIGLITIASRA